ncbi:MAG: M56 family metallopeptidase [Candidatus Levybacteria bacterium]|nr:M56 family metallopeptidase [Candidatus Levybacteria bacterium]
MIRINKNLALFLGLFAILGITLLFIIQKLFPLIGHAIYYCQSFISSFIIHIPHYLSIIPLIGFFLIIAIYVIKFIILIIRIQILKNKLIDKVKIDYSKKEFIKNYGLKEKIVIIESNKLFAFCFGIRAQKIYISEALLSRLSKKEIKAVILHEEYHLKNHDTFIMLVASALHSFFPFFPLLSDIIRKYRIEREIKADKFAVARIGDRKPLISALKKLLSYPIVETIPVAAIADYETLEPRIYSLVNKNYNRRQFRLKHLFLTLLSSVAVIIMVITPVYADEIHDESQDILMLCSNINQCVNSCSSSQSYSKAYFENSSNKSFDKLNASFLYTPRE